MQQLTLRARKPEIQLDRLDESGAQLHPVILRILANRGIEPGPGLDQGLKHLLPPRGMKGIVEAAERIMTAIAKQQSVQIVGDYDVDGATSTTLAIRGLRSMGLRQVGYVVPNRFSNGYGLSLGLAEEISQNPPALVITVDNGISSIEGVNLLQQQGVDVIVTDHHLAGDILPSAFAIVNPNQPGCQFADKSIAGVGVMFYLLLEVNARLRETGYYQQHGLQPDLLALLDLVALGTVADVVRLSRNNRVMVSQGIARMRAGKLCPGIAAILAVADRDYSALVAQDLGFVVGPRLNAAGRLEDISTGIECLLSDDLTRAGELARKLDAINHERKAIEQNMQRKALEITRHLQVDSDNTMSGLVLYDESWHEGVVGLVASRLKEKLGLPVLVFAPGEDTLLKGSARSIPQVHIRDLLANIAARYPGLIDRFGGHAMAAGLSIQPQSLDRLREAFEAEARRMLAEQPPDNTLMTDGGLSMAEMNQKFAETIKTLLPWGQGCPEPLFDSEFEVLAARFVGQVHLKLVLCLVGERDPIDAIYFRYLDSEDTPRKREALELKRVRAAYSLDVNHYRGRKSLQLIIRYLESLAL